MIFTDDDLKRYKQELDMDGLSNPVLKALLARLEAAEEMLPFFIEEHKGCPNPNCVVFKQVKAWRKAAGK